MERFQNPGEKGFTLTEILIVVVILGLLASFALPRFMSQDERGIVAEAIGMLSAIRQAELAYSAEHSGAYTSTLDDLDVTVTQTKFTYLVDSSGNATATRASTAPADYKDKTIILNINGTWSSSGTHPFSPK